jgi:hypothetical protein
MKLSELANLGKRTAHWVVIRSEILKGECIILLLNPRYLRVARMEHPNLTVYLPHEIEELYSQWRESNGSFSLAKLHLAKRKFDGEIRRSAKQHPMPE